MRESRLDQKDKPVNYISLAGQIDFKDDALSQMVFAELEVLSRNPDTALLAVALEMQIFKRVMQHVSEDMHQHIQAFLSKYDVLHTPVRARLMSLADSNAHDLTDNYDQYISRLTQHEKQFINYLFINRGSKPFSVDLIDKPESDFKMRVCQGAFAANRVFVLYLQTPGAFPESLATILRRVVALSYLSGKTSFKHLRSLLKKECRMSVEEVEQRMSECLAEFDWVLPMDMEFAKAISIGKVCLDEITLRCDAPRLLSRLTSAPVRAMTPARLPVLPGLILDLCERCPTEKAYEAARYLANTLRSPRLIATESLPNVIDRLSTYDSDPAIRLRLTLLRYASGQLSASIVKSIVLDGGFSMADVAKDIEALVKDPLQLREMLLELDHKLTSKQIRRVGEVFINDLGI